MERSLPLLKECADDKRIDLYQRTEMINGVMLDCHRGIYIGEEVQRLANSLGWKYSPQFEMVMYDDDAVYSYGVDVAEEYTWAWDEAEEWLNAKVAKDDHYFGSMPMAGCGCWGYWSNFDSEEDVNV